MEVLNIFYIVIGLLLFFVLRQTKSQKYSELLLLGLSIIFLLYFWGSSIFLVLIPILVGYIAGFKPRGKFDKVIYYVVLLSCVFVWYAQAKFNIFGFRGKSDTLEGLALLGASYILIRLFHLIRYGYQLKSYRSRLNYLLFLPSIPIGPIHNIKDYQLSKIAPPNLSESIAYVGRGLYGFLKIFVFSAIIAPYALDFDNVSLFSGSAIHLNIFLSLCAYSFYLYWNFSGAIDIVISLSRLIGWRVPENFNLPFLATNIQDFWRRWHMTLTNSFRDLVFIPFVKSIPTRKNTISYYLVTFSGILIVFTVSALWHNFSVNYLLWGLWHAFFMILYILYKVSAGDSQKDGIGLKKSLGTVLTFIIVSCGWLFFIYPSPAIASKALNYNKFSVSEIILDAPYSNTILVNYNVSSNTNHINAYIDDGSGEKLYQQGRESRYNFIHFHGSGKNRALKNGNYQIRLEFFDAKGKLLYSYNKKVTVENGY